MISVCCVDFTFLDVFYDELKDCAWNLGLKQLSDECVCVYGIENFTHIECCSFIASWTGFVVSMMLYPCILCVALLRYMFVLCV